MKLNLNFENFTFDYQTPIIVGKTTLSRNEALIVTISAENFKETVLHLCSLPHYHRYSIREWEFMIRHFFSTTDFDFSKIEFDKPYFNTTSLPLQTEGECNYALESVLFAFIEKNFPQSLLHFDQQNIKINGLYSNEMEFDETPGCVKIKIRPSEKNLEQTLAAMKKLLSKKPECLFRFDGNRTFELSEMLSYLELLGPQNLKRIQYIEEPFKNFSDTYRYLNTSEIPLALDESVLFFYKDLGQFKNCFYVLKPSLLGLSQTFALMKVHADKSIISSSYEFPSALRPFFYLSSMNPAQYHGLDTIKFLPKEFSIKTAQTFLLSF